MNKVRIDLSSTVRDWFTSNEGNQDYNRLLEDGTLKRFYFSSEYRSRRGKNVKEESTQEEGKLL